MTSEEFAKAFYEEKESLLDIYFERIPYPYTGIASKSDVAELIKQLNLDKEKQTILFKIIDGALRDTNYSILLGLDGCAAIGNEEQQMFDVRDENGNKLTGDIEGHAYDYFHGRKNRNAH